MRYNERLRVNVIDAFNWAANIGNRESRVLEFRLTNGNTVSGGLRNHDKASFTIRTSGTSNNYTDLTIPFHSVVAIEKRFYYEPDE